MLYCPHFKSLDQFLLGKRVFIWGGVRALERLSVQLCKVCLTHCSTLQGVFDSLFNYAMFVCFSVQLCNVCWYHHRSTTYICCCFSNQLCNVSLLLSYSMMHDWLLSLFNYAMLDCLIVQLCKVGFILFNYAIFVCLIVLLYNVCLYHCLTLQCWIVSLFNCAMFVCIIVQLCRVCLSHCLTLQCWIVSLFNCAMFVCIIVQLCRVCLSHCLTMQCLFDSLFN